MKYNVQIGYPQLPDQLVFAETRAAQYLPPGGRRTAKRWMRNGDTLPFTMQSIQTVQPFPMYLFNEMHTDSEHIAVPHPPQCAHWGTFPPGEGIAFRHHNISKSSPEGIPQLISHIYLRSDSQPRTAARSPSRSRTPRAKPFLTSSSGRYSSYLSNRGSSLG